MTQPSTLPQPFDAASLQDPYATYARLRDQGAVHRIALPDASTAWLVVKESNVRAGLTDPRLSVNKAHAGSGYKGFSLPAALDANLLNIDPADHLRLRRLVSKAFTPRRIDGLRQSVQGLCSNLVQQVVHHLHADGTADVIDMLAAPLPLAVIGELLGIPEQDRQPFATWVGTMQAPSSAHDVTEAIAHIYRYLLDLIALRRRQDDGNLISGLITVRDNGDQLSENELLSLAFLILSAGTDNTQHVISSSILTLLQHPDQLEAIRQDPKLIPDAVEELLRYTTPNHTAIRRFPTEDITIAETAIPAGDTVLLCLASAHRDPLRYPEPDRFDIRRTDKTHLTLGLGYHYCLGAPLARMQIQAAITTLIQRLPHLELALPAKDLPWRRSFRSHALQRLPVTLGRPT
ncbi:cytochrome P450 [Streptomyces sp. NPDC014746]|uniref:cytochrome P450 family protein n=1 Tax=Streptomyces sp. NPDC014746 TaxID=3364904 RepID=UPI0036FD63E0